MCKTKKAARPTLIQGQDSPSVKGEDAVYLIPDLEIIIYSTQKELKEQWEEVNPDNPIMESLWGWCDVESVPGVVRIHIRSVRSHGRKEEFYHTLGHEVAHVIEKMELETGSNSYIKARWFQLGNTVLLTLHAWKKELEKIYYKVYHPIYQGIRARLDRDYTKIHKELE
jgi:hypothetical protein